MLLATAGMISLAYAHRPLLTNRPQSVSMLRRVSGKASETVPPSGQQLCPLHGSCPLLQKLNGYYNLAVVILVAVLSDTQDACQFRV